MTKILLFAGFYLCTIFPCRAQFDSDAALKGTLHDLRDWFFTNDKPGIEALKGLIERMNAKKVSDKDQYKFLLNAWYAYAVNKQSPKYVRKQMIKHFPAVGTIYEDEDLNIVKRNASLVDLLNEGLLKPQFPFPLDEKSNLFREFREYGLKDSMQIGEIGAGSGLISLLIASMYEQLSIYINELDEELVRYLETRISQFPTLKASNQLTLINGSSKKTKLEGKNLDLIFMRDTFHHFSKKQEMVASIYQSLKEQGLAFVIEPVTDDLNGPPSCPQAMKKGEIIQIFEDGGFLLIGGGGNEHNYIFKFQKK